MSEVYVPKDRKESDFIALTPGVYGFVVEAVTPGWGQSSGKPYLTWELTVTDEGYAGARLCHRTSMDGRAMAYTGSGLWAVLKRLGLDTEFEDQELEFEDFAAQLAEIAPGCAGKVAVSQYEFEGKIRNDCDEFWASEEGPPHTVYEATVMAGGSGRSGLPPAPRAAPVRRSPVRSTPTAEPPY